MIAYYTDTFVLPLPDGHRFPMLKYKRLREQILETGLLTPAELHIPEAASDEAILRCHDIDYLEKVKHGTLSRREITRIGFPWSEQLVERSRRSVGATICAARQALRDGASVNLAGGTHHAGRDHGEGYSVFNDVVIAARALQAEQRAERILVIDCDVHQGNGTASICQDDASIYTFSIHGQKNFPFRKIDGDLDIGLADGTDDGGYLSMLEIALERAFFEADADFVIYVSGADPYMEDKLGKLTLSRQGLRERDEMVMQFCGDANLPVAVVMAGGYAPDVEDIVSIHLQTIATAKAYSNNWLNSIHQAEMT
jgi:acetoin utilization deacetylase AcuC-like enzyme